MGSGSYGAGALGVALFNFWASMCVACAFAALNAVPLALKSALLGGRRLYSVCGACQPTVYLEDPNLNGSEVSAMGLSGAWACVLIPKCTEVGSYARCEKGKTSVRS